MNRHFWLSALLGTVLMVSACAAPGAGVPASGPDSPLAAPESPLASPEATRPAEEETMPEPSLDSAAEEIGNVVRQMVVQQLGVDAGAVTIASVEAVDWPDACLGVSLPDVMCAQVITPGYRVVVEADGQQYEYHTDATGQQIVLATAPEAHVGDVWVEWQQTLDTCEALQIGSEGLAFGACMGQMMPGRLATPEREQELAYFLATYAPFQFDYLVY